MNICGCPLDKRISLALCLYVLLHASPLRAETETAAVSDQWSVWSCWFWPFSATEPPNLYGADEALARYDAFVGANSQAWEYDHHGPALNQPDWAGHCHAWSGASVWEYMPVNSRVCGGVTFRPRDIAALMTEAYYNDTLATEFSLYRPSPGLLWRWLRQEIMGQNSMHGHAMAVIGNLTQYRGEVWNYPVYQYRVTYAPDPSGGTYSGSITLWFADDGDPGYADTLGLASASVTYSFTAVSLDQAQQPLDSGNWAGNNPAQYPTSIWRPYPVSNWGDYLANPELDAAHLASILDVLGLGDVVNASSLKWMTGGDGIWQADTATSHDLASAARSGSIGHGQNSWLQTTVTGPGTISFWWGVSSESGYDFFKFFVDGQEQPDSISGEMNWQSRSYALPSAGQHTLLWVYDKDADGSGGADCAWLDEVTWTPALPTNTVSISLSPPNGGLAEGGGTFISATNVTVSATPNPGYTFLQWTEGDTVVSTSSNYSFTAATNRNLVANFTPGAPLLTLTRVGNQTVISWDTNYADYQLECTTNAAPPQVWTPLPQPFVPAGDACSVTNPITSGCCFFRLRRP